MSLFVCAIVPKPMKRKDPCRFLVVFLLLIAKSKRVIEGRKTRKRGKRNRNLLAMTGANLIISFIVWFYRSPSFLSEMPIIHIHTIHSSHFHFFSHTNTNHMRSKWNRFHDELCINSHIVHKSRIKIEIERCKSKTNK